MRNLAAYNAQILDGRIHLSRCIDGAVQEIVPSDWSQAIAWLTEPPAGDPDYFTVVWNLNDFTRVLFSLLPEDLQADAMNNDRTLYENVKIFHVGGRYLGLTATIPDAPGSNIVHRAELNLQALKWWVSEDDGDPATVVDTWRIGVSIVEALAKMNFFPTKLTSPVGVFCDCYLGDARKFPTVFSFPEEWFDAQVYATNVMRNEWRGAYQLGRFEQTHLYDLVSAYPSAIARLPSTDAKNCRCEHATERPEWAVWGIMYGTVEVDVDISPLVLDLGDGERVMPKGRWQTFLTTSEWDWLTKWGAGRFKMEDGFFFVFGKARPYKPAMEQLFTWKNQEDKMVSTLAKKMSQGVSGKLDEDRADGKKGDYYNPILAAMTRTYCRTRVANFIYENKLQEDLIAVLVDSVLSSLPVELPEGPRAMGTWRYEGETPAIVLSKGGIWRPGKRPQGIAYEALAEALSERPEDSYYEFKTASGSTRSIDLAVDGSGNDREFDDYPKRGKDVTAGPFRSMAVEVGATQAPKTPDSPCQG